MKRNLLVLADCLLSALVLYAAGAFIVLEPSVTEWNEAGRAALVWLSAVSAAASAFVRSKK